MVALLHRRLVVQIAVDLQHQVLAADQRVQSFPVSAGLPVKHRDFAKHPNHLEVWDGIRRC